MVIRGAKSATLLPRCMNGEKCGFLRSNVAEINGSYDGGKSDVL